MLMQNNNYNNYSNYYYSVEMSGQHILQYTVQFQQENQQESISTQN